MISAPESVRSLLLTGGFSLVAAGVLIAHDSPGLGYEPSIYEATPVLSWTAFGLALLIALTGALFWRTDLHRYLAIALGSTTMAVIVMLPIVRGYRYYGHADALTHLGWVRDITVGALDPVSLFYPGTHVSAIGLSSLMGISLERALVSIVVLLFICYLVFVPFAIRAMTDSTGLVVLGAVSSWLVLPMNQIATVLLPHTNSLTLLYIPAVLYVMIAYIRRTDEPALVGGIGTSFGVVLVVLGAGLILLHPQHALNVLFVFLGVSIVQFVYRRRQTVHAIVKHRPLYIQTAALILMFGGWVSTHSLFASAVETTLTGILSSGIGATSTVAQRGGSLTEIGAGLPEIFTKLFLVGAIYGLVTLIFVVAVWRNRLRIDSEMRGFLLYFSVGFIPLFGIFAFYFLGTPKMSFRQLGMLFVLITIWGAIAIGYIAGALDDRFRYLNPSALRTVMAVFFAGGVVLAVLTVFPSPFIYSTSPQVTDQHISGYETAFEHRSGEIPFAAMGSRVDRYGDAIQGSRANGGYDFYGAGEGLVDPDMFSAGRLQAGYPALPYYFAVTEYDVNRQIVVYDELHYKRSGLERLDSQPRVDLVQTNGEFDLYFVR